jgi:hypothetical protein
MLKDKIFTMAEFNSKIVCNLASEKYVDPEWTGTIEQALDNGKTIKSLDYFNFLWTAMQCFDAAHNRMVALLCLYESGVNDPIVVQCTRALSDFCYLGKDNLQGVEIETRAHYAANKESYSDIQKLVIKSAMAALNEDHAKSCPVVLLQLKKIFGDEKADRIVRFVLKDHP